VLPDCFRRSVSCCVSTPKTGQQSPTHQTSTIKAASSYVLFPGVVPLQGAATGTVSESTCRKACVGKHVSESMCRKACVGSSWQIRAASTSRNVASADVSPDARSTRSVCESCVSNKRAAVSRTDPASAFERRSDRRQWQRFDWMSNPSVNTSTTCARWRAVEDRAGRWGPRPVRSYASIE
jgi:hypothetical protein